MVPSSRLLSLAGGLSGPLFFALLSHLNKNMNSELRETILNLAMPLIQAQGLELWGLDIVPGPTLRVIIFVDTPQGSEAGPSIEQCEAISRQLSLAMDVEDCIDQAWTLEVSSPGLERKFFSIEQLRPYIGDILEARLNAPIAGTNRKRWLGRLTQVGEEAFTLEPVSISPDGDVKAEATGPVSIPWTDVARAQRVHIFTMPQKPGKSHASRKKQ